MKNITPLFLLFMLFSCGGNTSSEVEQTKEDSLYSADHEWIVSAKKLKKKLADLQLSFTEIGNKEVEETVCTAESSIPYSGNKSEMNIWLMSTYMLDNFSSEDFGKHNFKMPPALIRNETPLAELNWLNINSLDTTLFDIYKEYPDLIDIPKIAIDKEGMNHSNEAGVQNANTVLRAIEDGLLGVVVITDYVPPTYTSDTDYEAGYVMGYLMFADWQNDQLSCISPFLAQNSTEINFENTPDTEMDDKFSKEVIAMNTDLQNQTFGVIDSIARVRTGFKGNVLVNSKASLDTYKD
jgi:hypothetical protein